ncbi:hypothetical protein KKF84_19670 [Myxococcota bacterium]|nr:hypothetical protein [Myxococcota bacterium]MBU1537543.1 hypothetical protein [Myxococcota bacterium]
MRTLILSTTLLFLLTPLACDDGADNTAPVIAGTAPDQTRVDEVYTYTFRCTDADGDPVEATTGDEDTCSGTITHEGEDQWTYSFTPSEGSEDSTCILQVECSDGDKHDEETAAVFITHIPDIAELHFYTFSQWAEPIGDYITINASELQSMDFRQAISELMVFDDALYIGYGDADLNLGRVTPIEVRYFTSLDASDLHSDFATDEEEISLYRVCGGQLFIPGVDATEDDLMGNVYSLSSGGSWYKSRTLEWGWHVHDTACYNGKIYSVGSGGTIDDYNNSTVNAYLWESSDDGETFTVARQVAHPAPPGDNRLTQLLAVDDVLYAFGYYSSTSTSYTSAFSLESGEFLPYSAPNFFVLNTWNLSDSLGIAVGVNIATPLTFGAMFVTADGMEPVAGLEGYTVWDLYPLGDGRALVLYTDGDTYPEPHVSAYGAKVALMSPTGELTLITYQFFQEKPRSLAFWREHLFLGLSNGQVLINEPTDK